MKHCRWKTWLGTAAIVGILGLMGSSAWAASLDEGLELDGNIVDDSVADPPYDWADLFDVVGNNVPTPKVALPAGFGRATFIRDFVPGAKGPDSTTFATGSKDIQNPSGGHTTISGMWECNKDNNVGDKTDIVNAYATIYTAADGDVILYVAVERFSNEGEANLGFWFSQDPDIGCTIVGNSGEFTGNRTDGDLNIFAEFESGGTDVNIVAREWSGDNLTGFLNPTPIANGGDCADGTNVIICGNANDEGTITAANIPWLTETKKPGNTPSNNLAAGEFFEAAYNLTDSGQLACFSNYLADSRSSNSLTADLKDYAFGNFPLCALSGSKTCSADPDPGFCLVGGGSCTTNGDCGAGDRCVTTNPYIDSDGLTIVMNNDVNITNDGLAPVYDVQIKETATFGTGDSCAITAVNGASVTPVDLNNGPPNDWETVPNGGGYTGALAGNGGTLTVTVTCETDDNPFPNVADVRSASVDNSGVYNVGLDNPVGLDTATCTVTANPMLDLQKSCTDVRLQTEADGHLIVEVLTQITVTNTGDVQLGSVMVTDDVAGTVDSGQTLDPGDSLTYYLVDQPEAPGQDPTPVCAVSGGVCETDEDCTDEPGDVCDTDSKYDPGSASFSNTANASGVAAIGGATVNATQQTETCYLCPQPE